MTATVTPMLVHLRFVDVGRGKKTWTARITPTAKAIEKEIRQSRALMSSDINFNYDLDSGKGTIFAGMRALGRIERVA